MTRWICVGCELQISQAYRRYVKKAASSRRRKGIRQPLRDIVRDCPKFSDAEMAEKTPRWSLREFFRYTLRPWQEPEVPAPPGINTKPCGCASSSALRADIARFFLCGHGPRGGGITLGALPLKPRQEPEVPAPPGFYSEPCSVFSSSALRADIARFFYALWRISQGYVRGTLSP